MKENVLESVNIPQGVHCEYNHSVITCKKDSLVVSKKMALPKIIVSIKDNTISFQCEKSTKRELKLIKTSVAHLNNIFNGLGEEYTYKLEACNVHFPMTLKIEKDVMIISNFLGEKVVRKAKILPHVQVDIKGPKLTITSKIKENAGQTAANMEKATKIRNRDRRIFQDGIFITSKPGDDK